MGKISAALFKNRTKKDTESAEVSESKKEQIRDSRIDLDHSESTAPVTSDRSETNLNFPAMNSLDSACTRWSFNADIEIAKMSGPGFFKEMTTLEAMNANSDQESDEEIYYTTDHEDENNAMKKSDTSPQEPSQKSKGAKEAKRNKSPKRKKNDQKDDDQPSDSTNGKQQKKKKKGKGQKSKKHNKDAAESSNASDTTKDSSNQASQPISELEKLSAFQRTLKGGAADTKKSSHQNGYQSFADIEKLSAFQRKLKGGGTNQENAQAKKSSHHQGFKSFAEIDKQSAFQRKLKGTNNKETKQRASEQVGKTGIKKGKGQAATSCFADFFNNSLYQSVESFVRSPNNKTRKVPLATSGPSEGQQAENSSSPGDEQPDDACAAERTEEIDGNKIKAVAVARIRAFTAVRHSIQQQKQFLAAFDKEDSKDSSDQKKDTNDNHVKDLESIKPNKRESYLKLETELRKYESMLEIERTEISKQKVTMQLKQQSVEQLLTEEAQKNKSLQLRIRQLEVRLENCHHLEDENQTLQAQVGNLRRKTAEQKETISKMMTFQKSEVKRGSNPSLKNYLMEDSVSESQIETPDLEEQSGFLSISSLSSKAQGELLKLRSSLKHKNLVCQEQSEELVEVKKELESLKEQQGVKNLHIYPRPFFYRTDLDGKRGESTSVRDIP